MKLREFMMLVGGAVGWPLAARGDVTKSCCHLPASGERAAGRPDHAERGLWAGARQGADGVAQDHGRDPLSRT